jgi:hypothetical protein
MEFSEHNLLEDGYKSLGWLNTWHAFDLQWLKLHQAEYVSCMEESHKRVEVDEGRCVHLVYCPTCKIYWRVDSSD